MEFEIVRPALILIPDISGFTEYMSKANLRHSQIKVSQLLETILENNILDLSVSEIEGDAILFYDFNNASPLSQIIEQCQVMFYSFHNKLKEFKEEPNCQCGSCKTLQSLTLKFIVHYGDVGSVMVKNYCKLFGLDLIIAHRLMKNNIPVREYILLTEDFVNQFSKAALQRSVNWAEIKTGNIKYDNIGIVNFYYASLVGQYKYMQHSPLHM